MFGHKQRRWLWIALPALLIGGLSIARAQGHHGFGFHHHRPKTAQAMAERMQDRVGHLLDKLDATPAQHTQIEASVQKRAPELFALMEEGRTLRKSLKESLLGEKVDAAQVAALQAKLQNLGARLVTVGTEGLAEISSALTPAQRAKIADRLAFFED
jgi:Spy/CpxP family protein refolding chaperone